MITSRLNNTTRENKSQQSTNALSLIDEQLKQAQSDNWPEKEITADDWMKEDKQKKIQEPTKEQYKNIAFTLLSLENRKYPDCLKTAVDFDEWTETFGALWTDYIRDIESIYTHKGKEEASKTIKDARKNDVAVKQLLEAHESKYRYENGSPVQGGEGESKIKPIPYFRDEDLENLPPPEWLIPGILPKEAVATCLGNRAGTYKSFLAIDWSMCIGYGHGWLNHKIKQGGVVYIAGEGKGGMGKRIKAWKAHHGKQGNSAIWWITQAVNINDVETVLCLIETLKQITEQQKIDLIVIDTFSRNSGSADENSNKDVKLFMRELDRLKEQFKCTILLIHHVGKDPSKGIRGASAFTGDTETTIYLEHVTDAVKLSIAKQKDAEPIVPIHLTPQKVLYGNNPDESSIVLVKSDAPVEEENENKVSEKESVQIMYDVLVGKELTATEWVALGIEKSKIDKKPKGMSRRTAMNVRQELYVTSKIWYKKDSKLYYIPG